MCEGLWEELEIVKVNVQPALYHFKMVTVQCIVTVYVGNFS